MGFQRAMYRRGIVVVCVSQLMGLRPVGATPRKPIPVQREDDLPEGQHSSRAEELAPKRVWPPSLEQHKQSLENHLSQSLWWDLNME